MAEKEYIEREALSQAILDLPPKMDEQGYGWLGRRGVWQMVNDFPASDVRPVVRGKWQNPESAECYQCSACGKYRNQEYGLNAPIFDKFCPNCGADMREES